MRIFKQNVICFILILIAAFAVSCTYRDPYAEESKEAINTVNQTDTDKAADRETTVFITDSEDYGNTEAYSTESHDEPVISLNGITALKNSAGKIRLFDDEKDVPLTDYEYDSAQLWQNMILLAKNNKKYIYNTDYYGTSENRHRAGFIFSGLQNGFDSAAQISEGIYIIENDGEKFPASLFPDKLYPDVDCNEINLVEKGRLIAVSKSRKMGLYYIEEGYFNEIYPQTADEIIYCKTVYTEDGDRRNVFFVKENGTYSVFIDSDDGYSGKASDNIYTGIVLNNDGSVIAVRDNKSYYISLCDGKETDNDHEQYRILQVAGNYKIIKYSGELSCGVTDENGNIVIPCEYGTITAVTNDRFFCSKLKGEDGVIYDNEGNIIAENFRFVYSLFAPDMNNTAYIVEIESSGSSKIALIDKNGCVIDTGYGIVSVEYGNDNTYIINNSITYVVSN